MSTPDGTEPPPARGVEQVRDALHALYAELDDAVSRLAPVCAVSGRCCRFVEYDHTLFLCEAEAALLLAEAPPPARPLDGGATCPWQDEQNRCTAREARPLGCRVYFCDPAYQPHAPALSEEFVAKLKRLSEATEWPWNYAPLHHHLRRAAEDGRFPAPPRPV